MKKIKNAASFVRSFAKGDKEKKQLIDEINSELYDNIEIQQFDTKIKDGVITYNITLIEYEDKEKEYI